ncbi:MAG: hypothetical protein R3F49_18530 [Planctomycetota bacterium]
MVPLALARWTITEHARRPATWALLALFGAAWPAILVFGELGLTTRDGPLSTHSYEVTFLALLVGVTRGVETLARGSWFLGRAAPMRQIAAEAGALAGAATLPLAAALLPALWLAPAASGARDGAQLAAIALTGMHLLAIGLVALRLPLGPQRRALAVPLAAWVLPALVGTSGPTTGGPDLTILTRALTGAFDVSRHGRLGLELEAGLAHRCMAILPMIALTGAAWLLLVRAPTVHALRNPR